MTRRQSLRQALVRRWMAFAAALSLLFAGATLLLLFVLEDSFIDRRLRAVAASPAVAQGATAALPAQFRVLGWQQLADAEQRRLEGLRTGAVAEFRREGYIDLKAFWGRRFRRLLPAALLTLMAVAVAVSTNGELPNRPGRTTASSA